MACTTGCPDSREEEKNLTWVRAFYQELFAETGGVPLPGEAYDGAFINHPDTDLADPTLNTSGVPCYTLYYKRTTRDCSRSRHVGTRAICSGMRCPFGWNDVSRGLIALLPLITCHADVDPDRDRTCSRHAGAIRRGAGTSAGAVRSHRRRPPLARHFLMFADAARRADSRAERNPSPIG